VLRAEEKHFGYVVGNRLFPQSELSEYTPLYRWGFELKGSILVASIKRSEHKKNKIGQIFGQELSETTGQNMMGLRSGEAIWLYQIGWMP
jgi:hypothetical protein